MPNSLPIFLPKKSWNGFWPTPAYAWYHLSQQPWLVPGKHGLPIPASVGQGSSALYAVGFSSSPVSNVGLHSVAGNIW